MARTEFAKYFRQKFNRDPEQKDLDKIFSRVPFNAVETSPDVFDGSLDELVEHSRVDANEIKEIIAALANEEKQGQERTIAKRQAVFSAIKKSGRYAFVAVMAGLAIGLGMIVHSVGKDAAVKAATARAEESRVAVEEEYKSKIEALQQKYMGKLPTLSSAVEKVTIPVSERELLVSVHVGFEIGERVATPTNIIFDRKVGQSRIVAKYFSVKMPNKYDEHYIMIEKYRFNAEGKEDGLEALFLYESDSSSSITKAIEKSKPYKSVVFVGAQAKIIDHEGKAVRLVEANRTIYNGDNSQFEYYQKTGTEVLEEFKKLFGRGPDE